MQDNTPVLIKKFFKMVKSKSQFNATKTKQFMKKISKQKMTIKSN